MMEWVVLTPLLGAVLSYSFRRKYASAVAVSAAVANLVVAARLSVDIWRRGSQQYSLGGWGAPLGIELHADGLSAVLLMTLAVTGTWITLYARGYFRFEEARDVAARGPGGLFWPLWLFLWAAFNGLLLSSDLFNIYVLLEVVGLSAVALAALGGRPKALLASLRYALAAFGGSLVFLMGVALLYAQYHTLDLRLLGGLVEGSPAARTALMLMTVGMAVKTALFPLHFWLPSAHAAAIAPVSALLSALVVKASFYVVLRVWFDVMGSTVTFEAGQFLGVLGSGAILWGSIQAMRQTGLKLLIAHSTVGQIGYLFLIFPLMYGGETAGWPFKAWNGGMYQLMAHALAKASMFLAAGVVVRSLRTDRLSQMAGMAGQIPLTTFALGLSGVTLIGLPPTGGFLAKWLLMEACLESGQWWWAPVLVVGGLLTAGYVFLMLAYTFQPPKKTPELERVPQSMEMAALFLALMAALMGLRAEEAFQLLSVEAPWAKGD